MVNPNENTSAAAVALPPSKTSGASHTGLIAPPAPPEVLAVALAGSSLLRLKSESFTVQAVSTSRFGDLTARVGRCEHGGADAGGEKRQQSMLVPRQPRYRVRTVAVDDGGWAQCVQVQQPASSIQRLQRASRDR